MYDVRVLVCVRESVCNMVTCSKDDTDDKYGLLRDSIYLYDRIAKKREKSL